MTSQSETPLKKKARFLGMSSFGSVLYTALGGWLFAESSLLALVCIISAPVGFSLLGELGNKTDKMPRNHVLQRMRPMRYGCHPRSSWAGLLSLGRSTHARW